MLEVVIYLSLIVLSFSVLILLIRLIRGPSVPDRIMAADSILLLVGGVSLILSVKYGSDFYIDIAILVGVVAFVGTVALTKFIIKGRVIDGDRD